MTRPQTIRPSLTAILTGLVCIMTLLGTGVTFVRYIAPLGTLPQEVRTMGDDINTIGRVQAVQTEALKTLAEVASDTKAMRRDVDDHTTQIEVVKQRLQHLERRP